MIRSLCILGRQPPIGLAELESLYGPDKVRSVGQAALIDVDPCLLAFDRLGGSVKFCKVLTTLETTNWKEIEKFLVQVSPGHSEKMPAGKMTLGLSNYGLAVSIPQITATALSLKKAITKTGRSVRVVPNKELALSSAQVLHNHLTDQRAWELVFIKDGSKTVVAQTVKVQDIDSYTLRDRGRPKRDPRVGMLPPKLAQIIINLAVGELPDEAKQSVCEIPPDQPIPAKHFDGVNLLDPFCGTGVILQEALLMGYNVYGSDIEPRMVDYSRANLNWLAKNFRLGDADLKLEAGDATNHQWSLQPTVVASETYLGRPFSALPSPDVLQTVVTDVNTIVKKFLQNLSAQTKPGFRLCLAVPAWKTDSGFRRLPLLDQLTDMGYTRLSFVQAKNSDLIYHREGQIVGRELVVLIRK